MVPVSSIYIELISLEQQLILHLGQITALRTVSDPNIHQDMAPPTPKIQIYCCSLFAAAESELLKLSNAFKLLFSCRTGCCRLFTGQRKISGV